MVMEEDCVRPLILVVGDVGAKMVTDFCSQYAAMARFVRVSDTQQARLQAFAAPPMVVVVEHGPPENDAFAVLRFLRAEAPEWQALAVVLARETMTRNAETQALGVRQILSLATATADDLHWAVSDALECASARRRLKQSEDAANSALGALHDAEERFARFMDALTGGAWIKDLDGRYVYVNKGFSLVFGASADSLIGRRTRDILPPDQAAANDENNRRALESEERVIAIETVKLPCFPERRMLVSTFVLRDAANQPKFLGGIAIDITLGLWQFIDKSPFGAAMFDSDMRLLAAGEKFWRVLGVETPMAPGGKANEIACVARIDWDRIAREILAGATIEPTELKFDEPDGPRWLRWSAYPWTNPNRKVGGAFINVEDITDAKRNELERRALGESYRNFFENGAFGAAEFSADGNRIVRVNKKFCDIGGYAPEDLAGRLVTDFIHPDELPQFLSSRTAFLQGDEKAFLSGLRVRCKAGGYRFVRVTGKPISDSSGVVVCSTAIVEDITEQIEAEAALRASEARFRVFFNNGAFGAIEVALDGRITRVNKALREIGGWDEAELPGRNVYDLLHPECREAYLAARADFFQGVSDTINRVWRFLRKDGSVACLRLHLSLLRDKTGAPLYTYGAAVDVTEQIKAEQALRASEARYRAFFNNGAFGALEGELSTRITNVNQFFAELGGYTPEEMIGRLILDFMHPADWDAVRELQKRFLRGEQGAKVEMRRYRRKDGTYVWVRYRPALLRDAEGAPAYVCAIAEDLSEELKAEEALRKSEERLRALSDNLPDNAVYTLTRRGAGPPHFSYISAGVEKIIGVTPEEAMADSLGLLQFAPPEFHADAPDRLQSSEQRLSDFAVEAPFERRDGRAIWIRTHARPTRLQDGGVVWDGVLTDITDRKLAEIALAQNEARLRAVLDGAQDGILSIDRTGAIQSVNAAAAAMFGYEQQELIGKDISMLCAECLDCQGVCPKAPLAPPGNADGRPRMREGLRKDGSTFPLEVRTCRGQIDDEPLYVEFMRDLSERRLLETRMKHLKEQRLAAMGGMAGALAHELNQPLAAIALHVESAQRLARLAPQERPFSLEETLDWALSQALRAGEIITHLRQFAARGEPDKSIQSLHALLREVCASAPDKGRGRVELRLAAAHDRVFIDKVQIKLIFHNLIRNAFEAMANASDPILTISTRNDGDKAIVVDFADRGHGVSAKIIERLFEPLATTKPSGMGVGLSFSRAIASIHSGSLSLCSSTAQGATFTLMLPLHSAN